MYILSFFSSSHPPTFALIKYSSLSNLPIEIDFTPPCLETYGYTHTHMFLSSAHMGNILIYLFIHNFIL